ECVQHYFRQSEQLATGIKMAVGAGASNGGEHWRAGILMLQRLPDANAPLGGDEDEDAWRRALVLMSSATSAELLDPHLSGHDLLFRLFHEDGVRVTAPQSFRARCRCSRERVETVLRSLPREEIEALEEDGAVVVTCEFCSRRYRFLAADLDRVYDA